MMKAHEAMHKKFQEMQVKLAEAQRTAEIALQEARHANNSGHLRFRSSRDGMSNKKNKRQRDAGNRGARVGQAVVARLV